MGIFDGLFGGGGSVGMPKPEDYIPLVQEQAKANRQDQFTPFGSITFDRSGGYPSSPTFQFSPQLQTLFDKQFSGGYDKYADDYMGRYRDLIAPIRENQMDRFEQRMFDRGMPEGGKIYGDLYRTTIGDPNARLDLQAAQAADQIANQRVMQDYNRLIAAMGGSSIPYAPVDVMGPANMALNADMANQQYQNNQSSNIWNTAAMLGSAAIMA